MKGYLLCFVFFLAVIATVSTAVAGSEGTFVQKCGSCHNKDGEAAPVNPADKAGLVWAKYFKRGRHPGDLSAQINEAEMASILQYLQDHAADSDHPVAAAIPK